MYIFGVFNVNFQTKSKVRILWANIWVQGFFLNFVMAKQLAKFPEELTKLVIIALEKTKSSKILPIVLPPKTTIIVDSKKYCKLGSWTPMYQCHSNCWKIDIDHLSNIYRDQRTICYTSFDIGLWQSLEVQIVVR